MSSSLPFLPWTSSTPPQGPSARRISTTDPYPVPSSQNRTQTSSPDENKDSQLWSNRFRAGSEGHLSRLVMTAQGHESGLGLKRSPLSEHTSNAPNISTSTVGLASPFIPSTDNVWGPPTRFPDSGSIEERLAAMEAKIKELTLENTRLKEQHPVLPFTTPGTSTTVGSTPFYTPAASTTSSLFFDHMGAAMSAPGYGSALGSGRRFEDEEYMGHMRDKTFCTDGSETDPSGYVAPHYLRLSVLSGTFNLVDIPVDCIRPIVWIIAKHQPRTTSESAGLKAAVNALAVRHIIYVAAKTDDRTRLGYPRSLDGVAILVDSIIEWAKPLCFTACGNYLCQQLLERGDTGDKIQFIEQIREDIVNIASDKFGTHVLCKGVAVKELEDPISDALLAQGIFDSLRTGARRLWREYLERRRQAREFDIFHRINEELKSRWADLACANEHGSIAVQQVFEVFGTLELMEPCAAEILLDISRVGNNQFGHFVISKLLSYPSFYRATCDAILTAYPPIATTHHGVNFAKIALQDAGRMGVIRYVDALLSYDEGRTPGIVAVATSSIGKGHLSFLLSCLTPAEHMRVRNTCRAYSTTLRNSQSGNDLLRNLGLIHATGGRNRPT